MIFTWKLQLAALGIAAVVAFGAGWKTRDAFCDAAAAKKQVEDLQRQIRARDVAAAGDQRRAANDVKEREQLEEKVNELQVKITEGKCFSADDVDSLRTLWLRRK